LNFCSTVVENVNIDTSACGGAVVINSKASDFAILAGAPSPSNTTVLTLGSVRKFADNMLRG
jgi:hypothetical protein